MTVIVIRCRVITISYLYRLILLQLQHTIRFNGNQFNTWEMKMRKTYFLYCNMILFWHVCGIEMMYWNAWTSYRNITILIQNTAYQRIRVRPKIVKNGYRFGSIYDSKDISISFFITDLLNVIVFAIFSMDYKEFKLNGL